MNKLHLLADRISRAFFLVAVVAGMFMMVHVTIDVAARTLFRSPLPGTGELTASYYMIAAAFLPWAYVTMTDSHITADLFTKGLSVSALRLIDTLVDIATAGYVGLFTWQAVISAQRRMASREVWEIPGGYLAVWPARWILPAAGAAMIVVLLFRILARLTRRDDLLVTKE
jgi:TRAP-type C4-dicarboxylate transport system permease small subunit